VSPDDIFGANRRIDLEIAAGELLERAQRCWRSADHSPREIGQ
jgi:hypothetical protein